MQRIPSAEAVRPTRRAISPRFAIKTEVIEVRKVVEEARCRACVENIAWANARDLEAGSIGGFFAPGIPGCHSQDAHIRGGGCVDIGFGTGSY